MTHAEPILEISLNANKECVYQVHRKKTQLPDSQEMEYIVIHCIDGDIVIGIAVDQK